MDQSIISPEELRAALVHALVSRLRDAGKIKIQKLMYFLQEAYSLPLECRFYMHHYGPYSEEVETSISNLRFMGYVDVEPDPEGYGFHVTVASSGEPAWSQVVTSVQREIDDAVGKLGSMEAWELELAATIHDVSSRGIPKPRVVSEVIKLKPRSASEYVERMFDRLVSMGIIRQA